MVLPEAPVEGKTQVGCKLLVVAKAPLAPRIVHLIGYIIPVVIAVVAIQFPCKLVVVELLICQEITQHPLCLKAIAHVIVGMSVELYDAPLVAVRSRELVIQQSKVRVRLGRDLLWVFRVVVCKGSSCRKIAVSGELRQPVVVPTGHTRLASFFDTSVHCRPYGKPMIDFCIDVHLHIGAVKASVVAYNSVLCKVADGEIVVYFVRSARSIHADIRLRRGVPYILVPVKPLVISVSTRHPLFVFVLRIRVWRALNCLRSHVMA